jgi:hypothetical protein
MASQNILKFYGSKLDIKVDYSELYDYEISKTDDDYNSGVLDLTTPISYSSLTINSDCLIIPIDNVKPWEIQINAPYTGTNCNFTVQRRTEKGWTLNFVFNRENIPWSGGSTFYYWGIKDEIDPQNYLDNNLSFGFSEDGRIIWKAIHYSGYCGTNTGYTETSYVVSGQTPVLCSGGTSSDFDITITFDRYRYLTDCNLENDGGLNDLITGVTVNNPLSVISGDTEINTIYEVLNAKWNKERYNRLGTLKIYLNGRPIYKLDNFEEIVPSVRQSTNPIVQVWGGGTNGCEDLHTGITQFSILKIEYFEEPLDFINVRHHYLTSIVPNFNIVECASSICVDNPIAYAPEGILTEDSILITTENNNILIY